MLKYLGFKRPAGKKLSLNQVMGDAETSFREMFIDQPKAWVAAARGRMKDLPKSNFEMGRQFAEEGKWFDAAFRFKMCLKLQPGYPRAAYSLGCCYVRLGKLEEAKAALLEALKQTPGNADVIFMLATLDAKLLPAGHRPTRMPVHLITGYFSSVAEGYDIAEAKAGYQAGKVTHELAAPFVKAANPNVLDLGCGSGIAARPWRAAAADIRGIDVTAAMLALAGQATHAEKKLYDALVAADIADLARANSPSVVDVLLLVNVAQFLGDLGPVFHGISKTLSPEGIAIVTVEPHAIAGEYGLNTQTSRFGHSNEYVKKIAAAEGLQVLKEASVELYAGKPSPAFILGKAR